MERNDMKIIANTDEMRIYDKTVKDIAQSLAQQCNKLSSALTEAQPFINTEAAKQKLALLLESVEIMKRQLPAIEDTGDIAKQKAEIAEIINDEFKF